MEKVNFSGKSLSHLMLGTVQFGLSYGVANTSGQPCYQDILAILRTAHEGGVNCLDTASAYGDSEAVLGRALEELGLQEAMTVVTKVGHLGTGLSVQEARVLIEASVLRSLRLLKLEQLAICLTHLEADFRYAEALFTLQERGLIAEVGSSTMEPEATRAILEGGGVGAVQIPANLLDRRFKQAGILKQAQNSGTAVFVRSIYLQGLLLMPESAIPASLAAVIPARKKLEKLAQDNGLTMPELAVRYMLGQPGVTCLVMGVDSVTQMRENVRLFDAGPLPEALQANIDALPMLPDEIILPTLWEKR